MNAFGHAIGPPATCLLPFRGPSARRQVVGRALRWSRNLRVGGLPAAPAAQAGMSWFDSRRSLTTIPSGVEGSPPLGAGVQVPRAVLVGLHKTETARCPTLKKP